MKCGVEESMHLDNICSQISAKILRLPSVAQDDRLGGLYDKLQFDFSFHIYYNGAKEVMKWQS